MSTRTATSSCGACCTYLCGTIGLFVCFLCCSGLGLGLYFSGCDPNGYCKGGITTATATGEYYTIQNQCSKCLEKCPDNSYGSTSSECCNTSYFACWDSFAYLTYKNYECVMQVDSNNDDQDEAIADAAAKYPAGKTIRVQSVKPSDDDSDGDTCITALDAKVTSYFGLVFISIAGVILVSIFVYLVFVCREKHTPYSPTGAVPSAGGVEMVAPGTMTTVPSAPSPPQSYPYSTFVSAPQTVGYASQPYQPVVSYGPPGPAVMYSTVPSIAQEPQAYYPVPQQQLQQAYIPSPQSQGYVFQAVVVDEKLV